MKTTIISGTNRPTSLSLRVAQAYQDVLAEMGQETRLLSLEALPVGMAANALYTTRPDGFEAWQEIVDQTAHFIFVVPEYNGSIPGILKLFIDACEYPQSFKGKHAAMLGLSAGAGGNRKGLSHLRDILEYMGARVLNTEVVISHVREHISDLEADELHQLRQEIRDQATAYRTFIGN